MEFNGFYTVLPACQEPITTRKGMVEVFKTNVQEVDTANGLIQQLLERFQADKISFDLEDCDKVLRVEGKPFFPNEIIALITAQGYQCEVLV